MARARAQALRDLRGSEPERPAAAGQRPIGDVLGSLLNRLGLDARMKQEEIFAAWGEIVGEFAARYSKPLSLKYKTLTVAVTQPTVLWTLNQSKQLLTKKLIERFGEKTVRGVKFQAG